MTPRILFLLLMLSSCSARSEIGAPYPDGGSETPPCGAGYSCPASGSWYDCMPPVTPQLQIVCEDQACQAWISANCPGVGFAY
jgi:hypothetical protein